MKQYFLGQNIAFAFQNQLKQPWIEIFNSHDEEKILFYRNFAFENCSSDESLNNNNLSQAGLGFGIRSFDYKRMQKPENKEEKQPFRV